MEQIKCIILLQSFDAITYNSLMPFELPVILFTDIEHSTQIWQKYPVEADAAFRTHDQIVRSAIESHGGRVIKHTGDGFFAIFESGDPLTCAIKIQQFLASQNWGPIGELRVRVSLHAGAVISRTDDFFGLEISRTERLLSAGWGGQILLSPEAAQQAPLPPGAELIDLGMHLLKDLTQPQPILQLNHPDLPYQKFPALRSLSAHPNNLPPQTTPFVGRAADLAAIGAQLQTPSCRLLTLVGSGGTGKTRMALQVAADAIEQFAHGVYFIPLAPLATADLIAPAIGQALSIPFHNRATLDEQVIQYLGQKQLLLVMDNFEHLLDGAVLVDQLLQRSTRLKILATSRERLNLLGEQVYPLQGMRYPQQPNDAEFAEYSAVKLFLQSAQRADPAFELNADNRTALIRICELVEGLPLGIELACGWVRVLSLTEIAAEIEKSLDFLNTGQRNLPERHRSLRGVFDYSWQLLDEPRRQALRRLSVFHNPAERSAAQKVAGSTLADLSALLDKSLLRRTSSGHFDMHPLIRPYAGERLAADPDEYLDTRRRHCDWFVSAARAWQPELSGPDQGEVFDAIGRVQQDLQAAWDWAVQQSAFDALNELLQPLFRFYSVRARYAEGLAAFCSALKRVEQVPSQPALRLHLMNRIAALLTSQENYEEAERQAQSALLLARQLDEPAEIGFSYIQLALVHWINGSYPEAEAAYNAAMAIANQAGAQTIRLEALNGLGKTAWATGRSAQAMDFFETGLALARQMNAPLQIAHNLDLLGVVARDAGDTPHALQCFEEASAILRQMQAPTRLAYALNHLGGAQWLSGNLELAVVTLNEALSMAREMGEQRLIAYTLSDLGSILADMDRTDETEIYQQDALVIFQQIGDVFGEAIVRASLATHLVKRGEDQNAVGHICAALKIGLETGILSRLDGLVVIGAMVLRRRGATGQALQLLVAVRDSDPQPTQQGEGDADLSPLIAEVIAELDEPAAQDAQQAGRLLNLETAAKLLQQWLCEGQ